MVGRRWARLGGLIGVLVVAAGCPASPPVGGGSVDAGSDDVTQATALLAVTAPLPSRSEVVALTNRLSIAATRAKGTPAAVELRVLAARLRERIWRFDRSATDAREAMELYGNIVEETAGTVASCEADVRRARLTAELTRDASATYRAAYLALERQSSLPANDGSREDCVQRLRGMLAHGEAFRPTGAAWHALLREAEQQASAQLARAAPSASATTSASASTGDAALPPPGKGEIVVVPDASTVGPGKKKLTKVQPYSWKLGGRVVLNLSAPARYETGVLPPDEAAGRGHRVYLDLFDTRYQALQDDVAASGLITRVRLGKRKFGTRVVVDLATEAARRVFYLPDPFRVVIDLSTRATEVAAPPKTPDGKRFVRRVALDPGHGGWDSGAVGPTGLSEKDVALDVAHRAAPALASELGIETMLTRDTDNFIELDERTARANAFQSDLFISIHCNATENGHASGLEVFILDPHREQDAATLRAVARENHGRHGGMDPKLLDAQLTNIAAGLGMGRSAAGSHVFADLLRKATLGSMGERFPDTIDHGTKTAGFFVLVGAEMPAVLYEMAFISNPDDEMRLGTADYRQKLADSIVNAVRAYQDGLQ